MRQLMEDKRIRYLLIAALVVVLVLGLLNVISTAFSLLVPLALIAIGGFAFYKIALEGRDAGGVMEDEIAESAGAVPDAGIEQASASMAEMEIDEEESEARQGLSAVERARSDFLDTATPAEEILDQIQSRKRRLTGDDET